jgi:hypothetical protein
VVVGRVTGTVRVVGLVVGLVVVRTVVVGNSQLGLLAPLVQQYFPLPLLAQQSGLLAPFVQQYFPLPPLAQPID